MRPDFAIIGAQKAGSTALMRYLGHHPEVHLPPDETRYFRDPWFRMQPPSVLDEAAETTKPGVRRRGIKCPDLLAPPEIPGRIVDALGLIDLVAVLRDPVARAVSAYFWCVQFGWLPIEDPETGLRRVLDGSYSDSRATDILDFGRYGAHLSRWLGTFPREKLFVVLDDELRGDLHGATGALFEFLGVDPSAAVRPPGERVNAGVYAPTRLRMLQRRNKYIVREFAGYPGTYLQPPVGLRGRAVDRGIAVLDRVLLARVCDNTPPRIGPELRRDLFDYYRSDIAVLEQVLDRDLSTWASKYDQ